MLLHSGLAAKLVLLIVGAALEPRIYLRRPRKYGLRLKRRSYGYIESAMTHPDYREQHKKRLAYMPWLYGRLKAKHRAWAEPWQRDIQHSLMALETVRFGQDCFVAPQAVLLAEPGRDIIVGDGSQIAADCVIHGPVRLGERVSLNHHVTLDGGAEGIHIGDDSRIAAYCTLYAFNHGLDADGSRATSDLEGDPHRPGCLGRGSGRYRGWRHHWRPCGGWHGRGGDPGCGTLDHCRRQPGPTGGSSPRRAGSSSLTEPPHPY